MTFCFEHLILVGLGHTNLAELDFLGSKEEGALFSDIEEGANFASCIIDTHLIFFSDRH